MLSTTGAFGLSQRLTFELGAHLLLRLHSKRGSVKWKNILWPESPEVLRKKEEAALRAQQEKAAILDRPAYKAPTKRANPAVVVPLAPSAPPPHYGCPQQYSYYNGPTGQSSAPYAYPHAYPHPPQPGYAYGPPAQPYQYSYPSGAAPPAAYPPPPGPYGPAYQMHPAPAPPTFPAPAASSSAYRHQPPAPAQKPLPPFSSFASMNTPAPPPPPAASTSAPPHASA